MDTLSAIASRRSIRKFAATAVEPVKLQIVLEAVRHCPSVKAMVVITSDKCYENNEWIWGYRESDPLGGYDPYSASKACAELVVGSFRSSFLNPKSFGKTHTTALASVRAGNVIGGGDWSPDRLIPDFVKATVKGEVVTLRNPSATRPWQHVLEPLAGYLWLAASMCRDGARFSEAWNFGPDDESVVTVETVVKHLLAGWGKGRYAVSGDVQPHEAHLLKLDTSKARSGLGWKPLLNIQRALQAAGEWYRAYYDGRDMTSFTLGQIEAYVQAGRDQSLPWSLA
ncbi:MAG: CDP-glucose 4,6-dehydratase [Candidatus Firestonebacteria bacterium]|nr:CDP-glucose 4,6-dehydratase [Candidatus Firestonebacteria bacterium]